MKLHLQLNPSEWKSVPIASWKPRRGSMALEVVKKALVKEKNNPSNGRESSGFRVVLEPDEEVALFANIRALYEPIGGLLDDMKVIRIFGEMVSSFDSAMMVSACGDGSEIEGEKPRFCITAKAWLK